jgi:hypothetical protein
MADPIRKELEALAGGDVLARLERLEKALKEKPAAKPKAPKAEVS